MRKATTTLVLTTALLAWATTPATAQDAAKPAAASADSAEDAFLKAYFSEKELQDYAAAEKAYAAVIATSGASHEVVARSTLGRARCLVALKRADEAAPLFARAEKEFAEFKDVAAEAHAALAASAGRADGSLEARIRTDMRLFSGDAWKYGERGVPTIAEMLKDDSPQMVYFAAYTLARMDARSAHEALEQAIEGRADTTYPEQVRKAVMEDLASESTLRFLMRSKDAVVRAHAIDRLATTYGDAGAVTELATDATLRAWFFRDRAPNEAYGRVLVAALAMGGEARAAALARLRGDPMPLEAFLPFLDPPDAMLSDVETLAEIAPVFATNPRPAGRVPSPALVAAFTRLPVTAATGVKLTLETRRMSADPSAFVGAVARAGFPAPKRTDLQEWDQTVIADELVAALGPKPTPDLLHRLAAAWPKYRDWSSEGERLPAFLRALIASGVSDEASLLAFQEGLSPDAMKLHQQFTYALRGTLPGPTPIGAWAAKSFLRELALKTDLETHQAAAEGLDMWQAKFGDEADLSSHVPELVAALGAGGSDHLIEVLAKYRVASIDALKSALPTHTHKAVVVEALAKLGDKSSGDAVDRVLAEAGEIADDAARKDEIQTAATALIRIRGPAAKDALAVALTAHDGRDAQSVFEAIAESDGAAAALGNPARRDLAKLALEKVPGVIDACPGATNDLPAESLRALAIAALESSSVRDRRWGADQEKTLLDATAWDKLFRAAQDADTDVRDTARDALRAIRAKETEMAEFRAMGEERATRKRITSLIESDTAEDRRAGIAAIAATALPGMVNDLIRLAAQDRDGAVRDDARKALLAMAKTAAPAPQPTQPPAEKK